MLPIRLTRVHCMLRRCWSGLTPGEREAVYEAVDSLVRARLEKARSV